MSLASHEPSVRFFEDPAGHRVAYAVHGAGPPLLCTAWWVSHVEDDWAHPGFRRFFGALAQHHTVIRYDRPGSGLSDREREQVDLSSEVATLSGLVDHLELDQVSLLGIACAGPPSICLAAQQPERVARLVFFGSYVSGRDVGTPEVREAVRGLVRAHWGLGAKALADLFAPNLDAAERKALGNAQLKAASAEMSARLLTLTFDAEVRAQAQRVKSPALVLHRKADRAIPFAAGRELAATLPNARLQSLDGAAHVPWYGDVDAASQAMLSFLSDGESPPRVEVAHPRSLRREGELWTLRFEGKDVHLPDARGLSDLAILLAQPGEQIHVGVLWSGAESAAQVGGRADPVLDEQALQSYRTRMRELDEELSEAETQQLAGRAESRREEREALAQELRAAVGLGGRKRGLNDLSERARKAVGSRIRACLKKISVVHPALGEHLEKRVATGTYCSYAGDEAGAWVVE